MPSSPRAMASSSRAACAAVKPSGSSPTLRQAVADAMRASRRPINPKRFSPSPSSSSHSVASRPDDDADDADVIPTLRPRHRRRAGAHLLVTAGAASVLPRALIASVPKSSPARQRLAESDSSKKVRRQRLANRQAEEFGTALSEIEVLGLTRSGTHSNERGRRGRPRRASLSRAFSVMTQMSHAVRRLSSSEEPQTRHARANCQQAPFSDETIPSDP